MPLSEKLQLGLLGLIVFQCFFFALFLATQVKGTKKSNAFLAIFLAVLGTHMLVNLLNSIGEINAEPNLLIGLSALYGPLIYLHVIALQRKEFKTTTLLILHFLLAPFAIIASNLGSEVVQIVVRLIVLIQVYTYLFLALVSIKRFQKILLQTQSQYQRINLNWAFYMISFWILIACIDLISNMFNTYSVMNQDWGFTILLVSIFLFVNTLFFKGLVQPKLFLGISEVDEKIYQEGANKYKDSSFTDADIKNTQETIEQCLKERQVYTEPELSLEKFSEQIQKPARLISQTINTIYKTNFSDFINDKRIDEAKVLLLEENNLNVTEILYQVGFNSKSAFYEHFKKKTGLTPKEFKKEQK